MIERAVDELEAIGGPYDGRVMPIVKSENVLPLAYEAFGENQSRDDPRRVLYRRVGNELVYYKVVAIGNTRLRGGHDES